MAFIIQARVEEIIDSVYKQIENIGIHEQLGAGIVVAGGTANLENIISLVKFRTGMDARKAGLAIHLNQKNKDFQNPENYTALGLLHLITNKRTSTTKEKVKKVKKKRDSGGLTPWFTKVVQGVLDLVDDDNDDIALN